MQSQQEQESPSEEYLSDYLYIDTVRLSHFYSQLSEHGLVTQSKSTVKKTGKDTSTLNLKVPVISGALLQENLAEEALELQIDPAFQRPQQTLDALYEAGYLHKGLDTCRIGGVTIADGFLSICDIRMMKQLWQHMGDIISNQQAAHVQNPKERQRAAAAAKKEFTGLANILENIPHALQGSIASTTGIGWFTLKPECMLVNPDDLMFKHGADIPGKWQIVCILDAFPDVYLNTDYSGFLDSPMEMGMRQMLVGLRQSLGRPPNRYGVTPLMIFRTIKKDGSDHSAPPEVE